MSKITAIENAIIQLGAGEFQKFCDTFLSQKQYGKINGLGMKSGSLKTTIGNPDTYFRKDNGKYVCVAYTTQQKDIYEKLEDDIKKCLDPQKTKLPIEEIEEIICCHTSSNLLAGEDLKLHKLCEKADIKLTIYGVDEIAQQVYKYYPMIAKDFLGITLDTNQIMHVNEFVKLYDSNEMAAPLDTIFHGRKEELPNIIEAIRKNKVVIVYGAAGTGKTRIVLEAIRQLSREEGFNVLCVKNNNQPLYEDLIVKIDRPGAYLFFVDDANELSGLSQVIQYISKNNEGYTIKVVLTVRDYAKDLVVRIANKYTVPQMILLSSFSDDDIKEFLAVNMEITEELYVDQIIRIAEGNPRIAYMAGKLVKDTRSFSAIHDASQVYEQYYSTIIELRIRKDRELCLVAGILALVNAVFLNKIDCFSEILKLGKISEERFIKCIYILAQMEVVEIHKDQVAVMSDQCLSNYMLYYSFFKEKLIPFSEVLYVGYKYFKQGVIRSINILFNIFLSESLREYISEQVRIVWKKYAEGKEQCFEDFVVSFHMFRPEEAFLIAADKIEKIKQEEMGEDEIDFNKSVYKSDDEILGLLTGYNYSTYLETAIELLIEYVSKSKENAIVGYNFVKNTYGINQDSYRYGFVTQKTICRVLLKYPDNNVYVLKFILEVTKEYLKFEFSPTEMWRGNTFRMYHLEIKNTDDVKEYRKLCWNIIEKVSHKIQIEEFLKDYAESVRRARDSCVIAADKEYIDSIFKSVQLNKVKKMLIIRDLHYGWNCKNIKYERHESIFKTKEWKLLSILYDEFRYSDMEYEDYQKYREEKLKKFANEVLKEQIYDLIQLILQIAKESRFGSSKDKYNTILHSIEQIIEQLCYNNENAETLLKAIRDYSDDVEIYPGIVMMTLFKSMSAKAVFKIVDEKEYFCKNKWKFYFFELIPSEMVSEEIFKELLKFLRDESDKMVKSSSWRKLRFLDKFRIFDEDIYVRASRIIFDKVDYNSFIVKMYFTPLFIEQCYTPQEIAELYKHDLNLLREIYFFMLSNSDMCDLKGIFLVYFLDIEDGWLEEFSNYIVKNINNNRDHDCYRYEALWGTDNYLQYYDQIYEKFANSEEYISEWRLAEMFALILSHGKDNEIIKKRQETWILHIVEEHAKNESVVIIFKALSEADTVLRRKAILTFLRINNDYELFEKIPLDPSHWGGSVDEIIPQLTRRIEFLESLLSEIKGIKHLKHIKRIKDRIEMWKAQIKNEELNAIYRKLYQ